MLIHVNKHSINDILHQRHIFPNCSENHININLEIMVSYFITHPHHSIPIHFRIMREQFPVCLFVKALHRLT